MLGEVVHFEAVISKLAQNCLECLIEARVNDRLIAVVSTGDELASPGQTLKPGQIFDCNKPMLIALIAELGLSATDLGALPDDPCATREFLEDQRCYSLDRDFERGVAVVEIIGLRLRFARRGQDDENDEHEMHYCCSHYYLQYPTGRPGFRFLLVLSSYERRADAPNGY